jgi:hypothetical protein
LWIKDATYIEVVGRNPMSATGMERVSRAAWSGEGAYVYLVRLGAFLLIVAGILGKNVRGGRG